MSSSNSPIRPQAFTVGLGLGATRPSPTRVVTASPFGASRLAPGPGSQFRPMVFQPFDGGGQIIAGAEPKEEEETVEILADVEVVEAEPLPPPPDFEALKAAAWSEGFQQGYDE